MREDKPVITVVYGQKRLIAVYEDGNLIATHDKHTLGNGDFKRALKGFEKRAEIEERLDASFKRFSEIPKELQKVEFLVEHDVEKERPGEEAPAEGPKGPVQPDEEGLEGPKGPVQVEASKDRPAPLKAPVRGQAKGKQ